MIMKIHGRQARAPMRPAIAGSQLVLRVLLFSDEPNTLSLQQADQVLFIRVARVCF